MEENKNYTVIELAELIGVPRTTINDWLNRYEQYIVFIPQGKRKVYPPPALKILQQVALLRNEGKSFVQIEKALGENFPIKAECVLESAPQENSGNSSAGVPQAEKKPETGSGNSAAETEVPSAGGALERDLSPLEVEENNHKSVPPETEFALIARRQSEEITRVIGESFRNMDERIRELETLAQVRRKMSLIWFGAFVIFLILLGGVSFGAWHFLNKSAREKEVLVRKQNENMLLVASLREQSVSLIAESKNFRANAARLEKELSRQKADFEKSLKDQKRSLSELHKAKEQSLESRISLSQARQRESEVKHALEKERFAAERLAMLKEMESLKKRLSEQTKKVEILKKKEQLPPASAGKDVKKKAAEKVKNEVKKGTDKGAAKGTAKGTAKISASPVSPSASSLSGSVSKDKKDSPAKKEPAAKKDAAGTKKG